VLLRIGHTGYSNENDIYDLALAATWEDWFSVSHTIRVDVTAIKSPLKSLEFITLKIKDAICDRFRDREGERPSVDTRTPDMRISGFLDARTVTLYLDTSGEPLFKRGWRLETGDAPLRENLAAGLLRVSGWTPGTPLLDPMCGSGTLLIEAAQMLAGIPPGINRSFAFEKFHQFDASAWQAIREAIPAAKIPATSTIFGSDISGDMLVMARNNLQRAGIPFDIPLKQIEAQEVKAPTDTPGLLIANPPYGERLGGDDDLEALYGDLGRMVKERCSGWTLWLLSGNPALTGALRMKASRRVPVSNGGIDCRWLRYDVR
jgi:putative N6-adenine-specific DNA methylase